jgi:hypothetical protein
MNFVASIQRRPGFWLPHFQRWHCQLINHLEQQHKYTTQAWHSTLPFGNLPAMPEYPVWSARQQGSIKKTRVKLIENCSLSWIQHAFDQASKRTCTIHLYIYKYKYAGVILLRSLHTRGQNSGEANCSVPHGHRTDTRFSVASNGVRLIRCHEPPDQQRFAAGVPTKAVAGETRRELPFRHRHSRAARARAPLTGASSPSAFFARHTTAQIGMTCASGFSGPRLRSTPKNPRKGSK